MLGELLYDVDFVLMSETIDGIKNRYRKWREVFHCRGLTVIHGRAKVMASGGITKGDSYMSNVYSCMIPSWMVKAYSAVLMESDKLISSRCAQMKRVTP